MAGVGFWNERFWLPNNITWADLRDTPTDKYPQVEDLALVFPFAFVLGIVRLLFGRLVAQPIGACIGICPRGARKPYPNAILERVFLTITQRPDEKHLKGLEKQLDCWNQYKIKQWFALRRAQLRPSKMSKFKESLWKLMYYTGIVGYGLYVFSEEDFFYDLAKCWKNYPFQPLNPSIQNYYSIQLAFYVSLLVAQVVMVRRKAFRHLVMHHVIAIVLLVLSYVDNFIRIGCIILIAHDIADVWLETVKLLNYTKCGRLTHAVFAIFAIYFVATRLVYFPLWIINSTLVQSLWLSNVGFFPAYVIFNALLLSLLALHVYWALMFFRIGLGMFYSSNSCSATQLKLKSQTPPMHQQQPPLCNTTQPTATSSITHGFFGGVFGLGGFGEAGWDKSSSALYSDSEISETELNMSVGEFSPTYWFRVMPAAGGSPAGGVNGTATSGSGATLNGIFPSNIGLNMTTHQNGGASQHHHLNNGAMNSASATANNTDKGTNSNSGNMTTVHHRRNNSGRNKSSNGGGGCSSSNSSSNSSSTPITRNANALQVQNGHVGGAATTANGHMCH